MWVSTMNEGESGGGDPSEVTTREIAIVCFHAYFPPFHPNKKQKQNFIFSYPKQMVISSLNV